MLSSFSEFKFFQSFRVPVRPGDDLRFLVEITDEMGNTRYLEDASLLDISVTGLGLKTKERISVGSNLSISLQLRKNHLDLEGTVVRAFSNTLEEEQVIYGVEIEADSKISKFIEQYISSFSVERLKECLIESAVGERYSKVSDGLEMFSLLLSLFQDITKFGDRDGFVDTLLEEVVRILGGGRATIFLINPDSNELEAVNALGANKDKLRFDYRMGVAGSVFTSGIALNVDVISDQPHFHSVSDQKQGPETRSIICYPLHNREEKVIGVIEILNKRNQDRFSADDEKIMKVVSLIFSAVFHDFNPIGEKSSVRRFSAPQDRKNALLGKTPHIASLRNSIIKLKDLDYPLLVSGEEGVGKTLYSQIIHNEGRRGIHPLELIDCRVKDLAVIETELFGPEESLCKLTRSRGGSVILKNIDALSYEHQERLWKVIKDARLPRGNTEINCRFIATTTQDLGKLVDEGVFLKDLHQFLGKTYVHIEPLRRRIDDLKYFINYFLKVECQKKGFLIKSISPRLLEKLKEYEWPGNIGELVTCIERAVIYNPKNHIISELEFDSGASPLLDISRHKRRFGDIPHVHDHSIVLKDRLCLIEREMILAEIKRCNGNKSKAAKEMGISREALRKKLIASDEVLMALGESAKVPTEARPKSGDLISIERDIDIDSSREGKDKQYDDDQAA